MFLAFPLNDRPDWRKPPVVTLLLIALNCLIYFGPQYFDERAARSAAVFYAQSDLPRIELPRFSAYLKQVDHDDLAEYVERLTRAKRYGTALRLIEHEGTFLARLKAGTIVAPADADYPVWRNQRAEFESRRGTPFVEHWGSNPADWRPITAITAVFLHGSLWHLLGNMVFLFAFGYSVEHALGRRWYLAFYLLCGIGGAIGDLIARWGTHGVGIGASGAISGLMAMYAMLYGVRRIRFFYQFLFYFDYVSAPAIILLPAWVANELLQHWFDSYSNTAHMAHVGGLLTGALLTWLYLRRYPNAAVPEPTAPADSPATGRAHADAMVKALRMDEARAAFRTLLERAPQDIEIASRYFNLARLAPASDDFHRAAAAIFALKGSAPEVDQLVFETFTTYLAQAQPAVRLTPGQLARLCIRFARGDHAVDAARLARLLIVRSPEHDDLGRVLLAATEALQRAGDCDAARNLAGELRSRRPDSAEARMATALTAVPVAATGRGQAAR